MTSVAELIVTTGPIAQVGWASACSGVTSASSARGPAAERSAAGRQDQPAHLVRRAAAQALGQRRVLGVDRHDLAGLGGGLDQRAADDQRLLVGQRERGAGLERRQGGRSPTEPVMPLSTTSQGVAASSVAASGPASDRGHPVVALGVAAPRGLGVERQQQVLGGAGLGDGDDLGAVAQRLGGQQLDPVPAGGQPDDAEPVGEAVDEVERLGADRPRAAEDHERPLVGHEHAPSRTGGRTGPAPPQSPTHPGLGNLYGRIAR